VTLKAFIVALVLIGLGALWVRQSSLITHACQVGEGTPPVPAVVALFGLALVVPALHRLSPRLALSRREALLVYVMLTLAIPFSSAGMIRHFFPTLTVLPYFAAPENRFAEYQQYLPAWFAPQDQEVIRALYEGADDGRVPWSAWAGPLARWTGFLLVFFLTALCFIAPFLRPWSERERLTFPLVYLALELAPGADSTGRWSALVRSPLLWVGVGLSVLHNGLNMANAFNPSLPCLGQGFDLGQFLTEPPLRHLQPLYLAYRPELFGLGYLVSLDISLSIWVFYLLLRVEGLIGRVVGYDVPGLPFDRPQGTGAYLAMTLWLLGMAFRGRKDRGAGHQNQVTSPTWGIFRPLPAWALAGIGLGFLIAWCVAAGMSPGLALGYFLLIFGFALTYSRIRAETGVPMSYVFPRDHADLLLDAVGTGPFVRSGLRSVTVLAAMLMMTRTCFQSLTGTELETLRFGQELRWQPPAVVGLILAAILLGLVAAYGIHLTAYYTYGANVLEGGTTQGGYRTAQAVSEYSRIDSYARPQPPNLTVTAFRGLGFLTAGGLLGLRLIFLRCPFHPLGFALTALYGYHIWAAFLSVWLAKTTILKLGGARLYRRLVPLFLGLALGHFLAAGGLWGFLGLFSDASRKFVVWFT